VSIGYEKRFLRQMNASKTPYPHDTDRANTTQTACLHRDLRVVAGVPPRLVECEQASWESMIENEMSGCVEEGT
jgi:hypothetical protein